MLAWLKRRQWQAQNPPERDEDAAAKRQRSALSGRYHLLHKYLDDRYADAVVLTFAEIEDLLGFSLPDLARRSAEWWTSPDLDTAPPRFSDSWILANRTARPNLQALTVVFDRAS